MTKKIKMLIEVEVNDLLFGLTTDEAEWFGQSILMNDSEDGALYLHSNEIGDTVGRVKVLVVHDFPPSVDQRKEHDTHDTSSQ